MVEYSQGYDAIFNNDTLSLAEEEEAFAALNEQFGYDTGTRAREFEELMSATRFH